MTTNDTPRPKPAPPKKRPEPKAASEHLNKMTEVTQADLDKKKQFVRRPHLTERPFQGHEGLQKLQKSMDKTTPKKPYRGKRKESK